jgi:hypothetical protein
VTQVRRYLDVTNVELKKRVNWQILTLNRDSLSKGRLNRERRMPHFKLVGGDGDREISGEPCSRTFARGCRSMGSGGDDNVLKRKVMQVNKVLEGLAQGREIS